MFPDLYRHDCRDWNTVGQNIPQTKPRPVATNHEGGQTTRTRARRYRTMIEYGAMPLDELEDILEQVPSSTPQYQNSFNNNHYLWGCFFQLKNSNSRSPCTPLNIRRKYNVHFSGIFLIGYFLSWHFTIHFGFCSFTIAVTMPLSLQNIYVPVNVTPICKCGFAFLSSASMS